MENIGPIIIPILICIARIADVTLGTVRIIFISRGQKLVAPVLGFFEILIWLAAMTQIMQNLTSWYNYIAFAGGFAIGNYLGMTINERLAMGYVLIRLITTGQADAAMKKLNALDYGITTVAARGISGDVQVIFTVVRRKDKNKIIKLLHELLPGAFITIEDVLTAQEGVFPERVSGGNLLSAIFPVRKGK